MVSKALKLAFNAAGLGDRVQFEVPGNKYFAEIRHMFQPMNRDFLVLFCDKSECLTLGVDESPRKVKKSNVMSIALTNENGEYCIVKIAEHNQRNEEDKSTLDTELVFSILESELGSSYQPTMKKTIAVLSDSCKNAKATREKIAARLDIEFPLETERLALPCVPHAANIAEEDLIKHVSPNGRLESLSRKVGATISPPSGLPMDNIFGFWHQIVPEQNFLYSHGKRFRHRLFNIVLAFNKFDDLKKVVDQTKSMSAGAASIAQILEEPEVYLEMAICCAMLPLLDFFWSKLSTCQTGSDLTVQIENLAIAVDNVETDELEVDDYLKDLDHRREAAVARSIIERKFSWENNFNQKLKESFLKVTKKLLQCLRPYLATDNQGYVTTPHNITIER